MFRRIVSKVFGKTPYVNNKYQPLQIQKAIITKSVTRTVSGIDVLVTCNGQNAIVGIIEGDMKSTIWDKQGNHPNNPRLNLITEEVIIRK